jgi:hypothetical protein
MCSCDTYSHSHVRRSDSDSGDFGETRMFNVLSLDGFDLVELLLEDRRI